MAAPALLQTAAGQVGTFTQKPSQKKEPSSTVLTTSLNPSVVGQAVTLAAKVSAQFSTPSGTVQFFDGSTLLGTGNLDANGFTSLRISALPSGTHPVTAAYGGDRSHFKSTSATLYQVVNTAPTVTPTSTSMNSSMNPSQYGQAVTFSAAVTTSGAAATGTVQFFDGGSLIGNAALNGGVAAMTTASLAVGNHSITASYGGDSSHSVSSSSPLAQAVNAAATTTTLWTSLNPVAAGQAVTFTAKVSAAAGTPTGSVRFLDGATVIGSAVLSAGSASLTTSSLAAGTHPITASYSGDVSFAGSASAILQETISGSAKQATNVTLVTSANPVPAGQPVTFRATVTAASGTGTPTGSVQFLDGTTAIGSGALSAGIATITTSSLTAGVHPITASYSGDSSFSPSASAVLQQTMSATTQATNTTLVTSANPVPAGQAVTFRATVAAASGTATPTGSVKFMDGTTAIGSGVLSSGSATFTTSSLTAGVHPITASYSGDSSFSPSASPVLQETMSAATQSANVALVTSANPVPTGQPVTFRATVTAASGTGTPTGSVQFLDGTTAIGSGALSAGSASFTTNSLASGTHPITASYSGDSSFSPNTSAVLQQTMSATTQATNVTLVTSANPVTAGQTVTFQATVTAASGTPSGTVQFMDGTTSLGSGTLVNGAAQVSASLTAGTHPVKAVYSGDSNYQSSTSAVLSEVVNTTATAHSVALNWVASSSASLAGYNVYRGSVAGGPYTKINSSIVSSTSYTDTSVQAGQTYYYVCTAVDTSSNESAYSNQTTATVPTP